MSLNIPLFEFCHLLKFQERSPSKEDDKKSQSRGDSRKSKSRESRKSKSRESSKSKSRESSKSKSRDSSKSGRKEILSPTLVAKAASFREKLQASPEEEARLKKRVCKIF
jgi:hypothetical protein